MKIISNFHDYYDTAQCYHGYCSDSEVIFYRKEFEEGRRIFDYLRESFPNFDHSHIFTPIWDILKLKNPKSNSDIRIDIIGFCGKLYFPICYQDNYFYSVDKLVDWLKKESIKIENGIGFNHLKVEVDEIDKIPDFKRFGKKGTVREQWKKKYVDVTERLIKNKSLLNLFLEMKTPCFHFQQRGTAGFNSGLLTVNCNLGEVRFFEQFDPMRTYQEIEMFFNSVLVKEPNPPQIVDDVVLAEKKGFDRKISFRYRPKEKK
jgi:hypothetical protein